MDAGCWAARVVASCVVLRDSVAAARRSVKSVMTTIISVAVQVAILFSRRVFLTKNVLAFSWMSSRYLRKACLLAVVSVV